MNSYYQNLLKDVVTLFQDQKYEKANQLIDEELSMPYVPQEAHELLEHYKDECRPYLSRVRGVSDEELEKWCDGSESQKERAVTALLSMNLRQYLPEVRKLLKAPDLLDEFKGELIEALIEQKVDGTFQIRKAGSDELISFSPAEITPSCEDPVVQDAKEYLDKWLSADNPSLENFCLDLLKQEILEKRPHDFKGEDPKILAASLVRLVYEAMMDREGYDRFARQHGLDQLPESPLLIEKRGEYSL